jgi:hypothetical protein
VIAELERGAIDRATLVWRDGMAEWLELHQVAELAVELNKIEAKKRAAAAAAAAANKGPVHKPRAPMPTVTGLAGLPGAASKVRAQQPSSPELPKPRAQQPSSPELPRPRQAQASAPVLPKPPATAAPPPAPPPPMAPAIPAAAPPWPMAAAAPPPPLPPLNAAPDVTPPLPASVANVVSRPPQVPAFPVNTGPAAPFATGPAVVSDHATVEWPQAKSKAPLIVGVIVVAAVLIGIGVLALGGSDAPPPATPVNAAPPAPTSTPATPTAAPAAPAAEAASQPGSDTASGSDPVVTAPDTGATPGAGFAELFAAGARKAESKGNSVAPAGRFDAAATKAPLAEAATQAQACKQSGGPTGKVTVVVTFDPNGKVSSATITDPPFAGTATGACISSALKRVSIAPFSGLPGTVSKTFSIL